MNGKWLMIGILAFTAVFTAGLVYSQLFGFYDEIDDVTQIDLAGQTLPVHDYQGIDAASSGLKLRACFRLGKDATDTTMDPVELMLLPKPATPTPLNPPFWFDCFDAAQLTDDLASGQAFSVLAQENELDGIDRIVAFYPSGRGYMWRQLNEKYQD